MEINFIREDLNEEQLNRITHVFKFFPDIVDDIDELFRRLLYASEEEYSSQLLNDGRISTINEMYQYRLFLYVKHIFDWKIPSEFEVSQIFNIPNTAASTLIKNMKSRYQFQLVQSFKDTLNTILDEIDLANPDEIDGENYYKVNIRSRQLVREINELIAILDPSLEGLKRYNNISTYFKIAEQTRQGLLDYINQ